MGITGNIILQTKRLNISIPTMDSLDNWYELRSNPDIMKYIGNGLVNDMQGTKLHLLKVINHYKINKFTMFDIWEKVGGNFIGEAGLTHIAYDLKNPDIELGYKILPPYQGLGYATELAETFIKWGFDNFHLNKIVACCDPNNIASSNVMKKCNMKYRGKYLYNGKNECDIYQIDNKTDQHKNSMGLPAEYQQIPEYFDKHNICDDTELKNGVVEKLLKQQNAKNILDMTCGTGSQVFYLTKCGYKVTGSDFSPELIKLARKKAEEQHLDIEFIDGDVCSLKVGSFDAVITMFNAIGHLSKKDFAKALKNISENLSENGIYIFDIFNLNAMTDKVVEDLKMDQKFEIKNDKIQQIQYSRLDRKNAILTSYDNYKIKDKSGKIKEIDNSFDLQIYPFRELEKILTENSFKVLGLHDIYGKEFAEDKSLNMLVLAQKLN